MQQIILNRGDAKVLAAAAALGAIEQGQPTADKIDEAEKLRRDAVAILQGSGKSPQYVLELAVRISTEAGDPDSGWGVADDHATSRSHMHGVE